MKAVQITDVKKVELIDLPEPELKPGYAKIDAKALPPPERADMPEPGPPVPPPGRLVFGRNRYFWRQDAIKLPNSGWYLMIDDFLDGRAVVFRMLDSGLRPIRGGDSEIVCVIVREK